VADNFTVNKSFIQMAAGSHNDSWSGPLNAQVIGAADTCFGGSTAIDVTGVAAGVITLTLTQYQPPNIIFTGPLTASLLYVVPPGIGWLGTIFNNASGAFSIGFGASGGASVTLPQGKRTALVIDSAGNVQLQQSPLSEGAPTALVGLTPVSGSAGTAMDSASAPALNTSISPTWTGNHTFNGVTVLNEVVLDNTMTMNGGSVIDGTSGTIHVQTQATSDTTNLAASNAFVHNVAAALAPLASPIFTGVPEGPTPTLSSPTGALATVGFVNPGSSLSGTSGYSIRSDGSIEMWGITASGGTFVTTSFPTITGASSPGFPNACKTVVFNPFSNTDWFVSNPSASRTGFTVTLGASGAQGCWFAIGS
jgi:hypothetical protein